MKVVGSVIRLSIGFANKWGHRRRNVALSYQHIQNYARLRDRTSLSAAIQHAIRSNYIERVEKGFFDPDAGKLSKAAVYALHWAEMPLNTATAAAIGTKSLPAEIAPANRFENQSGIGSKTRPDDRHKNPTDIEIKQGNKTFKQQPATAATFERLKAEGFDDRAAETIALRWPADRIERQIFWLDARHIRSNRLGMLRTAIEQDWERPVPISGKGKLSAPNAVPATGETFTGALESARQRLNQRHNPFTS